MMKRIGISIWVLVLLLAGCGPSKEKEISQITVLEQSLVDSATKMFNPEKARELIGKYEHFAATYPGDTISAGYLFKMSELQTHAVSAEAAIVTLDRIVREYPDYRRAPECLFLKAFIYDNNLNDLEKAKTGYLEFMRAYPDHYFADDARVLLDNLGKSPEELIRQFEEGEK